MGTRHTNGLLEGETIVALMRVRFSAGMPSRVDAKARPNLRPATLIQRHAYAHWARVASAAGFPIGGPEMMLGITQERLVVWRPALIRSRPRRYAGALSLSRISSASVHRRVFSCVLTMLFDNGTIVGVETTHGSRLRRFAAAIPTYTGRAAR